MTVASDLAQLLEHRLNGVDQEIREAHPEGATNIDQLLDRRLELMRQRDNLNYAMAIHQ